MQDLDNITLKQPLEYSLRIGEGNNYIEINPSNGRVTLSGDFNYDDGAKMLLEALNRQMGGYNVLPALVNVVPHAVSNVVVYRHDHKDNSSLIKAINQQQDTK